MNKFKQLWINLRSSFWFMPSLIVVASITLALVLIEQHSTGSAEWLARVREVIKTEPEQWPGEEKE